MFKIFLRAVLVYNKIEREVQILHPATHAPPPSDGTCVTRDEPALPRHHHAESVVYLGIRSWFL